MEGTAIRRSTLRSVINDPFGPIFINDGHINEIYKYASISFIMRDSHLSKQLHEIFKRLIVQRQVP